MLVSSRGSADNISNTDIDLRDRLRNLIAGYGSIDIASSRSTIEVHNNAGRVVVVEFGNNYELTDNSTLAWDLDKLVHRCFSQGITSREASKLGWDTISGWEYLSFLFQEGAVVPDHYDTSSHQMSLQLFNFGLHRVDKIIRQVFEAVQSLESNVLFQTEVLAAVGLLRIKMMDIYKGLKDGTLAPRCVSRSRLLRELL